MTGETTSTSGNRPRPGGIVGLFVLNFTLLGLLGMVTFAPDAEAQLRARGEYTMVGGSVQGAPASAVYIVDVVNQELIALVYDHNNKEMQGIGYRNLAADAADLLRGQARPGN